MVMSLYYARNNLRSEKVIRITYAGRFRQENGNQSFAFVLFFAIKRAWAHQSRCPFVFPAVAEDGQYGRADKNGLFFPFFLYTLSVSRNSEKQRREHILEITRLCAVFYYLKKKYNFLYNREKRETDNVYIVFR